MLTLLIILSLFSLFMKLSFSLIVLNLDREHLTYFTVNIYLLRRVQVYSCFMGLWNRGTVLNLYSENTDRRDPSGKQAISWL